MVINPKTGQLRTGALVDREQTSRIICDVTATDNGTPNQRSAMIQVNPSTHSISIRLIKKSVQTQIDITVIDTNDNAPVLTASIDAVAIDECVDGGTTTDGLFLSQLTATDRDDGDFGAVSYLMSASNLEGVDEFDVDLVSGALTVRDCSRLDYEKKNSYSFLVEARDFYRPGVTSMTYFLRTRSFSSLIIPSIPSLFLNLSRKFNVDAGAHQRHVTNSISHYDYIMNDRLISPT